VIEIMGIDRARQLLGDFTFVDFPIVRSLRYYEKDGDPRASPTVDLVLESNSRTPPYRLTIRFEGVRAMRIAEFGNRPTQITGLGINNMSDRQWEAVGWEVYDYEDDHIHFYAWTAEILACEPLADHNRPAQE
jgi:hypothetical protein